MTLTNLVRTSVHAPQFVEFSSGPVRFEVRVEFGNQANNEVVVASPENEAAVFWHILNDKHREIARGVGGEPREHPVSVTVPTAHPCHEHLTAEVDARKLRDGRTFTLRIRAFGQPAETTFVAVKLPKLSEAKADAAAGKRKVTKKKKKAAKKTASKKKAAKKKTGKKKAATKKAATKKATKKPRKKVA